MGKIVTRKVDFTTGIVGAHLKGRLNAQQYDSGVNTLTNFDVIPQGPIKKRRGTELILDAGFVAAEESRDGRLIPFQFSEEVAFVIVATNNQFVILDKNDNQQVQAIATPYTAAQVPALQWIQFGNLLYLTHQDHPPMVLARRTGDVFTLSNVAFSVPPNTEFGREDLNITATTGDLSALGATVTLTLTGKNILDTDIGRTMITPDGGQLTILSSAGSVYTCRVERPVTDTIPFNAELLGTPTTFITLGTTNGDITLGARVDVQSVQGPDTNAPSKTAFDDPQTGFLFINGGIIDMSTATSVTANHTLVGCKVISSLNTADGTFAYTFAKPEFETGNYPRCVTTYSGRLVYAATPRNPQRVWISKTDQFTDFGTGTAADDGLELDLVSTRSSNISWLSPDRDLVAGCAGVEISIGSTTNQLFSPGTAEQRTRTSYGSRPQQPIKVNNQTVFIRGGDRKLSNYGYNFQIDGYDGADLTFLADDIAEGGQFVEGAYINTPEPRLYMVLRDGSCAVATYIDKPGQTLIGWSKYETQGQYVSVTTLSDEGQDRVYVLVNRQVTNTDGTQNWKQFVEEISLIAEDDDCSVYLDAALRDDIISVLPVGEVGGTPSEPNSPTGTFLQATAVSANVGRKYTIPFTGVPVGELHDRRSEPDTLQPSFNNDGDLTGSNKVIDLTLPTNNPYTLTDSSDTLGASDLGTLRIRGLDTTDPGPNIPTGFYNSPGVPSSTPPDANASRFTMEKSMYAVLDFSNAHDVAMTGWQDESPEVFAKWRIGINAAGFRDPNLSAPPKVAETFFYVDVEIVNDANKNTPNLRTWRFRDSQGTITPFNMPSNGEVWILMEASFVPAAGSTDAVYQINMQGYDSGLRTETVVTNSGPDRSYDAVGTARLSRYFGLGAPVRRGNPTASDLNARASYLEVSALGGAYTIFSELTRPPIIQQLSAFVNGSAVIGRTNGIVLTGQTPVAGDAIRFPDTGTITVNYGAGSSQILPLKNLLSDGRPVTGRDLISAGPRNDPDEPNLYDFGFITVTGSDESRQIENITLGQTVDFKRRPTSSSVVYIPQFAGQNISIRTQTGLVTTHSVPNNGQLPFEVDLGNELCIVAGLIYEVECDTLPLNIDTGEGGNVTQYGRSVNVTAKLYNSTTTIVFNNYDVPTQMVTPTNANLYTGDLQLGGADFNAEGVVFNVKSSTPYPLTILGFYGTVKGNVK